MLLNENIWPEFISISTWIFKNASSNGSDTRRQQHSSPTRGSVKLISSKPTGELSLKNRWSVLEEQAVSDSEDPAARNQEVDDMETTVLYADGPDQ